MLYIAELSCNHNGDLHTFELMVKEAQRAGATCIKVQLFNPDDMTHRRYSDEYWCSQFDCYLWELYDRVKTPLEWIRRLPEMTDLPILVSVFDRWAIDAVPDNYWFKIASPEINYTVLLHSLPKDRPVFVSTGLASKDEIDSVVDIGFERLCLMHCVTSYPSTLDQMNLYTILDLRQYDVLVGLSDHSKGFMAATGAIALGAVAIEKHFKVTHDCPDASWSLFPDEFADMVVACESMKEALGTVKYVGDGPYKRKLIDGKMVRVT